MFMHQHGGDVGVDVGTHIEDWFMMWQKIYIWILVRGGMMIWRPRAIHDIQWVMIWCFWEAVWKVREEQCIRGVDVGTDIEDWWDVAGDLHMNSCTWWNDVLTTAIDPWLSLCALELSYLTCGTSATRTFPFSSHRFSQKCVTVSSKVIHHLIRYNNTSHFFS